jgi:hypothetical protein
MTTNIGVPLGLISLAVCGALGKLGTVGENFHHGDTEETKCGENLSFMLSTFFMGEVGRELSPRRHGGTEESECGENRNLTEA